MKKLYRDRFDVKRAAPGFTSGHEQASTTHDCTTLGGNSGSVVLELAMGKAVGLHYAGIYEENNFAVPASALTDYIKRKRWNTPPNIETRRSRAATTVPSAPSAVGSRCEWRPFGQHYDSHHCNSDGRHAADTARDVALDLRPPRQTPVVDVARVEEVLPDFWDQRPEGVLAARVGYFDEDGAIGDIPCIAASVKPSQLASFELGGPAQYKECRYAMCRRLSKSRRRHCRRTNRSIQSRTTTARAPARHFRSHR